MLEEIMDFTSEYNKDFDSGLTVHVEKVGGGTVGKSYEGDWRYVVSFEGTMLDCGNDYHCGTPKTHEEAATEIHEIYELRNGD